MAQSELTAIGDFNRGGDVKLSDGRIGYVVGFDGEYVKVQVAGTGAADRPIVKARRESTRLLAYLTSDTSFGKGGADGTIVQYPAHGDSPAMVAGIIVRTYQDVHGEWYVEFADVGDTSGSFTIAPARSLDFATREQEAIVGRRLARLQFEALPKVARR